MTRPAGGVTLSRPDTEAVIGLLRLIAGWPGNASPAVLGDLQAHLRRTGARLQAADLPSQIAVSTAMLRYRQITGGTDDHAR